MASTPPIPPTSATSTTHNNDEEDTLYTALEHYPWHTDAEFQAGLRAILGQPTPTPQTPLQTTPTATPTKSPHAPSIPSSTPPAQPTLRHVPAEPPQIQSNAQKQDLALRARCFYFARKNPGTNPDYEAYKLWRAKQPSGLLSALTPVSGKDLPVPAFSDSEPSSADVTPSKAERRRNSVLSGQPPITSLPASQSQSQPQSQTRSQPQPDPSQLPASESTTVPVPVSTTADAEDQEATAYPQSIAEIMELIRTGQPIPGIKDIPDTVLTGQGTEATKSKRKKPWERDTGGAGDEGTEEEATAAARGNGEDDRKHSTSNVQVASLAVDHELNSSSAAITTTIGSNDLAGIYFGRRSGPEEEPESIFGASSTSSLFASQS